MESCYKLPEPFNNSRDWSKGLVWNKSANGYRIPTEAEWEYCARGGEEHLFAGGNEIDEVAWHKGNSGGELHPVGEKKANGYGLYDMSGNVWEWCWDRWDEGAYRRGDFVDPTCKGSLIHRLRRGGSYRTHLFNMRVSYRISQVASYSRKDWGFRLVRNSS